MTPVPRLTDLVGYLIVAGLMAAAGRGVVHVVRAPLPESTAWLLGPALIQALWAVVLSSGVRLGFSVRALTAPIWILTGALAIVGLMRARAARPANDRLLLLSLLAPIVLLLPYFAFGFAEYPGSRHPDGWSYVAYGQCLWDHSCEASLNDRPLYQWAGHLQKTRCVSSAELGFLSIWGVPGDTQSAVGLLLALYVFTLAASCAAIARTRGLSTSIAVAFVVMATMSGWLLNALLVANYDNLVAVAVFAGAGAAALSLQPLARGSWLVIGLCVSGLLYAFPELGIVASAITVVMCAERVWREPAGPWRMHAAVTALLIVVVLAPYAGTMVEMFQRQMASSLQQGPRPGDGNFDGLADPIHGLSAFWGLGGEHAYARLVRPRTAAAVALFLLLIVGLWRLVRDREVGLLAVLSLPLIAAPLVLFRQGYPYGAYKMILMGWWALAFTVVGVASGVRWRRVRPDLVAAACIAVGLAIPAVAIFRVIREVRTPPALGISVFRSAEQVPALVGGAPIGLFVEQPEASQWALYFLRTARLRVGDFDGYLAMPHVRSLFDRGVQIPWDDVRYVLTDAIDPGPIVESQSWTPVWRGGAYRLWDTQNRGWAIATEVSTPNGLEQVNGAPFFWMGGGATRLRFVSQQPACVQLDVNVTPGPSVASAGPRRVTLTSAAGIAAPLMLTAGPNHVAFSLPSGISDVSLTPVDAPNVPPAGPDTRPLILGVSNLTTTVTTAPRVRVTAVRSPNGNETVGGQPFFWLGDAAAELTVEADREGEVALGAEFVPGPSVAGTASDRRLRISVSGRDLPEWRLTGGAQSTTLRLGAGTSVIRLQALDPPTIRVQPNGDRRPLVVGVRGLHMEAAASRASGPLCDSTP